MNHRRLLVIFASLGLCLILAWTVKAAEPSFELTARYILEVVRAFRTAYVLQVVERTREVGISPQENWQKDAHFVPLPAQFVKGAASQVEGFEIGLIGLTPLSPENRPKTNAETEALIQLVRNREQRVVTFVDGEQFKAVSADLALVQSCVDCHNQHPRSTRRDFRRWDVMGGLVVRLKRDAQPDSLSLMPEPPKRPPGTIERLTPPPTTIPPWMR